MRSYGTPLAKSKRNGVGRLQGRYVWHRAGWTVSVKRVAVSCLKSYWQLVMGGVPQGAILGLMLFNILSDLDDELECTPSTHMMCNCGSS